MLFLGLVFLTLANVARVMLERHSSMAEGPRDAVVGVLFGVAIGCLLVGLWKDRRARGRAGSRLESR
jgi:hypothetical protein